MMTREYTVTGVIHLAPSLPVEAIGEAIMDSAADVSDNAAVSVDLMLARVEIECVVMADGLLDGLAAGKTLVNRICDDAQIAVRFADDRRPTASEWHIVDESAVEPLPVAV